MEGLATRYARVRRQTETLVEPLSPEDCQVQSMPDASPAKWHLAHTSWFFETFVLGGQPFDTSFGFLFNSYYEAVGERQPRAARGLLSRPSLDEVRRYRRSVDDRMLERLGIGLDAPTEALVVLGLAHEEQHQELILTDIKHLLGTHPHRPVYRRDAHAEPSGGAAPLTFVPQPGGIVTIGHPGPERGGQPFAFDNESPRHQVLLQPYALASRLVTAAEYLTFVRDGGYRRPELWLADGWGHVSAERWRGPLYWHFGERDDGDVADAAVSIYTLAGERPLDPAEPVVHVSYYEADAYTRWAGARLPTEPEWEAVAVSAPLGGNLLGSGALHPRAAPAGGPALGQLFGDAWEWTSSAYSPYPGFRPAAGALGEYNGKFMCNQIVLRGGSCFTPAGHVRPSYRNFFPPAARWQASGIRLARDA